MKRIAYLLVVMVAIMTAGCRNSADMETLLEKVPSDADLVIGLNVESLVKKSGLKNKKDALPAGFSTLLKNAGKEKEMWEALLKGETGLSYTAAVYFSKGGEEWLTCLVEDEKATNEWLNKGDLSERAVIESGILWLSSRTKNPGKVNEYMNLEKEGSILTVKGASGMEKMERDIEIYGNIEGLLNGSGMSFRELTELRLMLASLFNDARYLRGGIEFDKGEMEGELTVLNTEAKAATLSIEASKLTKDFLSSISGQYDLLAGFSFSEKSVNKVLGQYASILSRGGYGNLIEGFSGTMCMGMNVATFEREKGNRGLSIVMQFKDGKSASKASEGIRNFLGGPFEISAQGKNVIIGTNLPAGSSTPTMVDDLSGSSIGLTFDCSLMGKGKDVEFLKSWKSMTVKGIPENKSLKIEFTMKSNDSNENSLQTLIKTASSSGKAEEQLRKSLYD